MEISILFSIVFAHTKTTKMGIIKTKKQMLNMNTTFVSTVRFLVKIFENKKYSTISKTSKENWIFNHFNLLHIKMQHITTFY